MTWRARLFDFLAAPAHAWLMLAAWLAGVEVFSVWMEEGEDE